MRPDGADLRVAVFRLRWFRPSARARLGTIRARDRAAVRAGVVAWNLSSDAFCSLDKAAGQGYTGQGDSKAPADRAARMIEEMTFLMAELLEAAMLVCFGLSWPLNAYKSYRAGTAAGSSWQFILLITAGYLAGIAAKFASGSVNWVLAVYLVNLACIGVNWGVYVRNRRLDAARDGKAAAA